VAFCAIDKRKSTILQATPETDFNKQVGPLRDQRSPERLNALFDRIKDC
jgi:hypothetical protein